MAKGETYSFQPLYAKLHMKPGDAELTQELQLYGSKIAKCSIRAGDFLAAAPQRTLDHPTSSKSFKMRSEISISISSNKK